MALDPSTTGSFAGRVTAPDANYPWGSSKNETTPGAGDGTPYNKIRADDIFGFQQALLVASGQTPSGSADTAIASQYLNAVKYIAANSAFPSGTRLLFQQTAAPAYWTKQTSHNDKALRVTSGSVTTGGTFAFSTAFASRSITGTTSIAGTAITVAQMPSHNHDVKAGFNDTPHGTFVNSDNLNDAGLVPTEYQGGNQPHGHAGSTISVNNLDMTVQYVDVIIAQKD